MLIFHYFQVFLVRKNRGKDAGCLYAMKVLKKATLKGKLYQMQNLRNSHKLLSNFVSVNFMDK